MPKMPRSGLVIALSLMLLVGAASVSIVGSSSTLRDGGGAATKPVTPIPVLADQVRRMDVPVYLEGIGVVKPFNAVTVRARVDGQIDKIAVSEGQEVNAGDPLAKIDPRPLQALLDQANAKRASDAAQLANATSDLQRDENLTNRAVSRQATETQKALVAKLTADVQADDAAIDSATVQLGYTDITAPISGRVGMRLIDLGNIVRLTDATGIVTINQIRPISVDFALPANTLPQLRTHMALGEIAVTAQDSDGGDLAQGKLTALDNQVDVATATIHCRASFENANEALWPGQFVSILVRLSIRHNALVAPKTAIVSGPEGTYVFVIDTSQVVRKRMVKVAFFNATLAIVEDGLQSGEQVVTDGQYRIQAGSVVQVLPATSAGSS